jgi:hypothetical protein
MIKLLSIDKCLEKIYSKLITSFQKGVNFETLGSWNNRIDMPIMIEESIKTGKLIPEIPLDQVGKATLLGRRKGTT